MKVQIDRLFALGRYHKPSQFVYRAWNLVRNRTGIGMNEHKVLHLPPAKLKPKAEQVLGLMAARRLGLWMSRHDKDWLEGMTRGEFRYLNRSAFIAMESDGNLTSQGCSEELPRLWWFHWQCQESLLEVADSIGDNAAWQLIEQWLMNPNHRSPLQNPNAWHPFCISRRLPVWLMMAARGTQPEAMSQSFWQSIHSQTAWLSRHLEWDLGGNHLLENLRTLWVATAFLESHGLQVVATNKQLVHWIDSELKKQILPSGEHYERTPTYHSLMLLSLIEIADALPLFKDPATLSGELDAIESLEASLHDSIDSMKQFLKSIIHPDGMIPLLGDSVFDETPSPLGLIATQDHSLDRKFSGLDYWVYRDESGCFLILDQGNLACDHLPAHGHADLLNIEASWQGKRFIVDGGTYDYEDSIDRKRCRGTSSHNTLQIDGVDHADVWSRFRMGRRGHVTRILQSDRKSPTHASVNWSLATHDAYQHLGLTAVHRFVASRPDPALGLPSWLVIDVAPCREEHAYRNALHFHPDWQVNYVDANKRQLLCSLPGEPSKVHVTAIGDASNVQKQIHLEESLYSPNFGHALPNVACVQEWSALGTTWSGWIISAGTVKVSVQEVLHVNCGNGMIEIHWHDFSERFSL